MSMNPELIREIEVLSLFSLDSSQAGIKIHHDAETEKISAAQRLFDKGFITQHDGGYLTDRGIEAAQHAQILIGLLST